MSETTASQSPSPADPYALDRLIAWLEPWGEGTPHHEIAHALKALRDENERLRAGRTQILTIQFSPDMREAVSKVMEEVRGQALVIALRDQLPQSPAIAALAAERRRQIETEGFSVSHDDAHADGTMALAAACYALNAAPDEDGPENRLLGADLWPWAEDWWKPSTRRRDLVKAGALIVAELDRMDRAEAGEPFAWCKTATPKATPEPFIPEGWQDISTAPKDDTIIAWWPIVALDEDGDPTDAVEGGRAVVTEWNGGYWLEPDVLNAIGDHMGDDSTYADAPSHWMPLPASPDKGGADHG